MTPQPFFLSLGIFAGFLGGLIPNDKSNIPRWMMAILVGVLTLKVVYGDFDKGFQWSGSDLIFYPLAGLLALIGYYMSKNSLSNFKI